MKKTSLIFGAGLAFILGAATGRAQISLPEPVTQALDRVNDALTYQSSDGQIYAHFSGETDLAEYYVDGLPFGLLYSNPGDHFLLAPRLTMNLDAAYGDRVIFFSKFSWDDGFDPNERSDDARLDVIYLRTVAVPGHLDFQAGKFATVFGSYVSHHDPWDNPFLTAPLPYDQVTSVLDAAVMPNAGIFAGLRNAPDNNDTWVPVIWGPSYTPGAAMFATWGQWDLAAQASAQALSSGPETWNDLQFSRPTFTSRLGWRPDEAWSLGVSGSFGPYLQSNVAGALPAGTSLRDYDQIVVGGDAAWSWHDWQVSGEFIFNRFQVPNVGNADAFSWYVEGKYQISTQLFGAVRWNQEVYNQVNTAAGPQDWDNNETRLDLALGYKWNNYILTKLQYSWQHQQAGFQNGSQLVGVEFIGRF